MSLVELLKAKQKEAEEYAKRMGRAQGREEGRAQGKEEGIEESTRKMVRNWLKSEAFLKGANTYGDIAIVTGLSVDEVKQIHQEMEK